MRGGWFVKTRLATGEQVDIYRAPTYFRHAICQENLTETHSRNESRQGYPIIPTSDMKEYYIKPERERHARCCKRRNRERVNLQILESSRQLYEEASYVFWSTNTFSFEQSYVLSRFLEYLNASQKQKLQKLHIITDMEFVSTSESINSSRQDWERQDWGMDFNSSRQKWKMALKPELTCLENLTSLHLRFDLRYGGPPDKEEHADRYGDEYGDRKDLEEAMTISKWWLLYRTRAILNLRNLPSLRKATVIISDDKIWYDANHLGHFRWTAAAKNAFADEYENMLLDPDPAAAIEAEEEAMNQRHRRQQEKHDNQYFRELITGMEDMKSGVIETTKADKIEIMLTELGEFIGHKYTGDFEQMIDKAKAFCAAERNKISKDIWGRDKRDNGSQKQGTTNKT